MYLPHRFLDQLISPQRATSDSLRNSQFESVVPFRRCCWHLTLFDRHLLSVVENIALTIASNWRSYIIIRWLHFHTQCFEHAFRSIHQMIHPAIYIYIYIIRLVYHVSFVPACSQRYIHTSRFTLAGSRQQGHTGKFTSAGLILICERKITIFPLSVNKPYLDEAWTLRGHGEIDRLIDR